MKNNTLPAFRPSTLDELAARRQRLQAEADLALHLLEQKTGATMRHGKQWLAAKTSVPGALTALTAAGVQQLAGGAAQELHHSSWPAEVERSIQAYEAKTENKWTAFLPLIVKAALEYYTAGPAGPQVRSAVAPTRPVRSRV